jgi:hypothetical protein
MDHRRNCKNAEQNRDQNWKEKDPEIAVQYHPEQKGCSGGPYKTAYCLCLGTYNSVDTSNAVSGEELF